MVATLPTDGSLLMKDTIVLAEDVTAPFASKRVACIARAGLSDRDHQQFRGASDFRDPHVKMAYLSLCFSGTVYTILASAVVSVLAEHRLHCQF